MDAKEARRQRREQRRAERQLRKEDRQKLRADRKAVRRARRAANKEARQARRENRSTNQNSLINKLLSKVDAFFDNEFDKIKSEYQAKETQGQIKANPNIKLADIVQTLRPYSATMSQQEQKVYDSLYLASEITERFKYQLRMVYEIAVANGYSTQQLPKEAVVYIMLSGLSSKIFAQPLINANKQIVVKPFMENPEARKSVAKTIATVVAMKVLRSVAARFLPGIGPMILDLFQKSTTPDLYVNAKYLFSQQPQFIVDQVGTSLKDSEVLKTESLPAVVQDDDEDFIKLLAMINLMKKDGKIDDRERELFDTMLQNSDLDEDEKDEIEESLDDDEIDEINLNLFKNNIEEAKALITDLVAIAKIDRSISQDEAEYIFKLCDEVGYNRDSAKMMLI